MDKCYLLTSWAIQPHRCINLPEITDPNPAKPCEVFWLLTCPWQFNRASLLHSYMQLVWKLEETRFFVAQKNPSGLMRSSRWGFAPLIFQNRCDCTRSAGSCWVCCCTPWHKQFQAPPAEIDGWKSHFCRKERVRGVSKMMKNTETPFILKKVIRNYLPSS